MDYNTAISNTNTEGPSSGATLVNPSPPITATGVPHFTVNPIPATPESAAVVHEGFPFEASERTSIEQLQSLAVGRGIPMVHYGYSPAQRMDSLSGMTLPYPQYPNPMLIPKQAYGLPHPYHQMNVYQPTFAPSVTTVTPVSPLITTPVVKSGPQIIYRNLFHSVHCTLQNTNGEWEGHRVYINDNVGYSGNAKRFKKKAEKGEKALNLEVAVFTANDQPATQCLACKDYFETQKYYKANPDCIGRIVLVKNNSTIRVENGQFRILIKMMCCCVHHTVDYFTFQIQLFDGDEDKSNRLLYSARVPLNVKQWRKSNQKKEECVVILEPKS